MDRIAKSLDKFRAQFNAASKYRKKGSDGWIGDAAHASRSSDHNPWIIDGKDRVVSAFDLTHDPERGVDCNEVAKVLINSRDKRIKYIIWNKQICSGADGPHAWQWRAYKGSNPHNKHLHLSVEDSKKLYDDDAPWEIPGVASDQAVKAPAPERPVLKRGNRGSAVKELQGLLNHLGFKIEADGNFGVATDRAVRTFQKANGLEPDGVVGTYSWEKLYGED